MNQTSNKIIISNPLCSEQEYVKGSYEINMGLKYSKISLNTAKRLMLENVHNKTIEKSKSTPKVLIEIKLKGH